MEVALRISRAPTCRTADPEGPIRRDRREASIVRAYDFRRTSTLFEGFHVERWGYDVTAVSCAFDPQGSSFQRNGYPP